MTQSRQPRKQRLALHEASTRVRRKRLAARLGPLYRDKDSEGNSKYPRSAAIRKGDMVLIVRGKFSGTEGKVESLNTKDSTLTIEEITIDKADKKKKARPIQSSNVVITKLDLSDPWRRKILEERRP